MLKKKKVCKKPIAKKKGAFATRRARANSKYIGYPTSMAHPNSKVGKTQKHYQDRDEAPHRIKRKRVSRIQGRTDKLKRPFGMQLEWGRYK